MVEAYDLLKLIYQSQGHRERDIPKLILKNNIFGLDIDDRAEQLTGFALMMKARQDDRRIFGRGIHLNICAFQNSDELNADQIWQALNLNGAWQAGSHIDMFGQAQADLGAEETDPRYALIQDLVVKFKDAKAFGSLLSVDNSLETTLFDLKNTLNDLILNGDSLQKGSAEKLLPIVEQAWILSQRYDAVIANPPYMGSGGMNANLKVFAKKYFANSKSDLFAMFMEQSFSLLKPFGFNAQVNMQSWMFLSSYEKLREKLLDTKTIMTMAHLGARAFSQISGEVVQTTTFVIQNNYVKKYRPTFFRLIEGNEDDKKNNLLLKNGKFSHADHDFLSRVPGKTIAYWLSVKMVNIFDNVSLSEKAIFRAGLQTGDNDLFLKYWYEIDQKKFKPECKSREEAIDSEGKWFPHNKGGGFRKWNGNKDYVINWKNDGYDIKLRKENDLALGKITANNSKCWNQDFYFKDGLTWSSLSSSNFSLRDNGYGFLFDTKGQMLFPFVDVDKERLLGLLNSKVSYYFLEALSPTLDFNGGVVSKLPLVDVKCSLKFIEELVRLTKLDWDNYENSWDFKRVSLLVNEYRQPQIEQNYSVLREVWNNQTKEVQHLEQENNKVFIDAYGLADELTPDVPLKEITLTCNPYYRYSGEATEEQLEQRLQSDTIAELISYAIGCMMGRYSLDREGLVYAHEGNIGFDELVAEEAYKTFPADEDGILPLLDEERFPDDVYSRFEQFIATAWDKDMLQQNLDFIAESLRLYNIKPKNGESSAQTIRRYLSNHFYKDQHLKTYKNRPIYWLFSSGKQKAFECLVYMHRFNDATLAKMRTQYVLPLMGQLTGRAQFLADAENDKSLSPAEKTKYAREADALHKKLNELKDFDAELKHYIEQKINIDLDDGVKVNYGKFSKLLAEVKKVTGNKE